MKKLSMLIVLLSLMEINVFAQTARTAQIKANLGLAKPELMGSSQRDEDCDTFVNLCLDDTLVIYTTSAGGYVCGHNGYGDVAKADIFYLPGTTIKGCLLYFAVATNVNTVNKFNVTIWDNDGTFADASPGAPGTILATNLWSYSDAAVDVAANSLTYVPFTGGGPAIPADSIFYCGIQFNYDNPGDTIALVSTLDRTGLSCDGIITSVEEWDPGYYGDNYWTTFGAGSWGFNGISQMIMPITCKESSCDLSIIPPGSLSVCNKKSITITATGATTYTWAPSTGLNVTTGAEVIAEPTETTTYTVSGNGGQCTYVLTVEVNDRPTSDFTIGDCSAGSRLLTRIGTPVTDVTFVWFINDKKIIGATNDTYLATSTGDYKVRTTIIETNCKKGSPTKTVTIDCKLGDAQQFTAEAYPNPFSQAFTINMECSSNELANVRLTDVSNRILHEYQGVDAASPFEINETLAPGVYFVRVNQGGNEKMIKIIKD